MRRYYSLALLAAIAVALTGCDGGVNGDVVATKDGGSTVNGSVRVPAGLHSGAVRTVNGTVDVEENASITSGHSVNGSIDMAAHSSADSLTAVNGELTLADGAHVSGDLTTVNGAVKVGSAAEVGGSVKNVNGHITLSGAHVVGGLQTVQGSIDVSGPSHVDGGILVQKSGDLFESGLHSKPRIVIGPGAVIGGKLRFEHDVTLYVSDKATVGPVEGATAVPFSGDAPPAG
jgi:DUF4097 and DUF4098 domain-containing protein YvlB